MRIFLCFIFSCLIALVSAEEKVEEPFTVSQADYIASLHSEPSIFIGGIVSPISGQVCLQQTDIIVKGAQEVALRRVYIPPHLPVRVVNLKNDIEERYFFAEYIKNHYRGWALFPHFRLTVSSLKPLKVRICEPNGLTLDFEYKNLKTTLISKPYGITNAAGDLPSGSYDPRNIQIFESSDHKNIEVRSSTGFIRYYADTGHRYEDNGIQHLYHLQKEKLPSGKVLRYRYNGLQLIAVESLDPSEKFIYGTLTLKSPAYKQVEYTSCTGPATTCSYTSKIIHGEYKFKGKNRKGELERNFPIQVLSSVSSPNFRNETAAYNDRVFLTDFSGKDKIFKCIPGGFSNQYRVKELQLPVGPNDTFMTAYTFSYDIPNPGKKGGSTTVRHFDGSYQVFRISPYLHITGIEFYTKEGMLLKNKTFEWDPVTCRLKAVELKGYYRKTFEYDEFGNPAVETFKGDLTGNGQNDETYTIWRDYSKDGMHLLLEERKEDGPTTTYTYLPLTNLVKTKTVKAKDKILLQEAYDYDNYNNLILKTINDGIEHRVTEYVLRQNQPFLHMPEWIIEQYIEDSIPILLKKNHLSYDQWGNVNEEQIYDNTGALAYTIARSYNERGDLLTETNPIGQQAVYTYDDRGRPKTSLNFSHLLEKKWTYDLPGRLRKFEEVTKDQTHTTAYDYDPTDRLILKTDYLGYKTSYDYAPFQIEPAKTTHPPIDGKDVITYATHDALGNKLTATNANGFITSFHYNAYGSPIWSKRPSGALETFGYYKNGKLRVHTDADGLTNTYTYDALEHVLSKTTPYSQETFTWSALHPLTETDSENYTTTYTYDKAGRKKTKERCSRLTEWDYDNLGRIATTIYHNQKNTLCVHYRYTILDQLEDEKKTDLDGHVLFQVHYGYDLDGNRGSITRSIQGKESIETFTYDPFHRLIEHKDPLGHTTTTSYADQIPPQKTITDPKQIVTITTQDAHGNTLKTEVKNKEGKTISAQDCTYDLCCNLLEHKNHIFQGTNFQRTQITAYAYTPENQIKSLTRASGTPDRRTTHYTYTPGSKIFEKTLPDRTILHHTYHLLGYLQELTSSDNKIHQTFIYDTLGYLHEAVDHILRTSIRRTVDPFGNILIETFNNSYSLQKTYDDLNRPLTLQLPDESVITYDYDPLYLRRVSRGDFSYTYDDYDLSSNILSENQSHTMHTYDLKGRQIQLKGPHFSQVCTYDEIDNLRHLSINGTPTTYTYDDLSQLASENESSYAFDSNYNPTAHATNDLNELLGNEQDARAQSRSFRDELAELSNMGDAKQSHLNREETPSLKEGVLQSKYDLNGNQTISPTATFAYDPLNRLISATASKKQLSFSYDPAGRRLSKTVDGSKELYLYDGQHEIASLNPDGSIKQLRIPGITRGSQPPLSAAFEIDGLITMPVHDIHGNLRLVLEPRTLTPLVSYNYTAFGKELGSPSSYFPWRYAGKRFDSELNLIYFGHRYYDPLFGRWLTTDPAGFVDSMNLYQYALNNPFRYYDPYGENLLGYIVGLCEIIAGGAIVLTGGVLEIASFGTFTIGFLAAETAGAALIGHGLTLTTEHGKDLSFAGRPSIAMPRPSHSMHNEETKKKKTNPFGGPVSEDVIVVDEAGNAIKVPEGNWLTGTKDGKWIQERAPDGTTKGQETGTRKDGGHKPAPQHTDPRSLEPHAHVPGVANPDGTPWLPIRK